jgi:hypothetical protein
MRRLTHNLCMYSTSQTDNTKKQHLVIWQQNLSKYSDAQLKLLHYLYPDRYDIAAAQEPHIDFLGNTQVTSHWITVYSMSRLDSIERTRALLIINR